MDDPLHSLVDTDELLQPYLSAAKDSKNISTIRSLIMRILSDSNIFAGYNEIHALVQGHLQGSPDGEKFLNTLELFSYGTFADYSVSQDRYLALNDAQVSKLKQLTALSLVEQACRNKKPTVAYDTIQRELQLVNANDVEKVLVSCIYARVLAGKLCQKTKTLLLHGTVGPPVRPRDVPVSKVSDLLAALQSIKTTISDCQTDLTTEQANIQKHQSRQQKFYKQVEERMKVAESMCASSASLSHSQRRGTGWGHFVGGGAAQNMARGTGGDNDDVHMDFGSPGGRRQKRVRGGAAAGMDALGGFRFPR
jgi:COP9 signalosome complex subunit 7